jgi:hypothetical protein
LRKSLQVKSCDAKNFVSAIRQFVLDRAMISGERSGRHSQKRKKNLELKHIGGL